MLARIQQLERSRTARSLISREYGSFDAFAAECEADMATGKLDSHDFPVVLHCLRCWDRDRTMRS